MRNGGPGCPTMSCAVRFGACAYVVRDLTRAIPVGARAIPCGFAVPPLRGLPNARAQR